MGHQTVTCMRTQNPHLKIHPVYAYKCLYRVVNFQQVLVRAMASGAHEAAWATTSSVNDKLVQEMSGHQVYIEESCVISKASLCYQSGGGTSHGQWDVDSPAGSGLQGSVYAGAQVQCIVLDHLYLQLMRLVYWLGHPEALDCAICWCSRIVWVLTVVGDCVAHA